MQEEALICVIDNAYDPDVSAKRLWINKTEMKDQHCLIFMDNGKGMDYNTMHNMLSFGFSDKKAVRGHAPVGLYGNGFKSGSMRLGKDAIVFTKKANTMCVGLLSQTYLEKTGAQNVIVPMVIDTPEHAESLHDILKYSLFNTKEELLSEFSVFEGLCAGSNGTRIIIWNLRRTSSGELEFDFTKDRCDFQIPVDVCESSRGTKSQQSESAVRLLLPESEYSLRAYCSILYLKPKMQIILQGQKVETQFITKTLGSVIKDSYKPVCSPQLKKAVPITFGYNTKTKEHYGLMMYHKNRLIKAYEHVTCQRRVDRMGVGVIGVIECNYLTPTHNKQEFDNTEIYRKTMLSLGSKLEEYCKEVRYRFKHCDKPVEDIVMKPDQTWVQCDDCLKWRKLADGIESKKLPKKWFCHMNSDPKFRSCETEEESEDSDDEHKKYEKTYKQDKRRLNLDQENPPKKKHKNTSGSNTPDSPSTATNPAMVYGKDQQNYLQSSETIKQLQEKVDNLDKENSRLASHCQSLENELAEVRRESVKEKVQVKDQEVQTDLPVSSDEVSATTSADTSNSGQETDSHSQQPETQERPESRSEISQDTNNPQKNRLNNPHIEHKQRKDDDDDQGKTIKITFGYNTKSKEHYGLMMYHKNRLIKAYERVPCQRKANSSGVGVIGVIECNYLKPTHNKQNTEEYRKTMLSVGIKLEHHWKEVGHRHKKILHCTEPIEDLL
ncbi:MORC family CW-type zinc finger protein 3 [Silurus meridionalis]|nr:MORC family CW-type zinc finger protein 3 [Silurus meridionalis]